MCKIRLNYKTVKKNFLPSLKCTVSTLFDFSVNSLKHLEWDNLDSVDPPACCVPGVGNSFHYFYQRFVFRLLPTAKGPFSIPCLVAFVPKRKTINYNETHLISIHTQCIYYFCEPNVNALTSDSRELVRFEESVHFRYSDESSKCRVFVT